VPDLPEQIGVQLGAQPDQFDGGPFTDVDTDLAGDPGDRRTTTSAESRFTAPAATASPTTFGTASTRFARRTNRCVDRTEPRRRSRNHTAADDALTFDAHRSRSTCRT
jgi:hypothetical protein